MKKYKNRIAMLLLALTVLVGGFTTLAYLTGKTEVKDNVFTVGKINNPGIEEPEWDPNSQNPIIPGKSIDKDPRIVIGADSVDVYAYIAVKSNFVYEDTKGNLKNAIEYINKSTNWEEIAEKPVKTNKYIINVYRYKGEFEDHTSNDDRIKTEPVFTSVKMDENLDMDVIGTFDDRTGIQVMGYLHQQEGVDEKVASDAAIKYLTDISNWK